MNLRLATAEEALSKLANPDKKLGGLDGFEQSTPAIKTVL